MQARKANTNGTSQTKDTQQAMTISIYLKSWTAGHVFTAQAITAGCGTNV
ncbi:hypothetical protein NGC71_03785 [Staphylococcus equorum]|nr:hypothetical protein [Staphylococcus equorum]MEB7851958.1 hypothetical protein [Staphylococcus equorum]